MTRLDALLPYDYAETAGNAANEYAFLLSELKRAFLARLHEARQGEIHCEDLQCFAEYCKANGCCCITFNYDDFLDEALARTHSWNPHWGYGFGCSSSLDIGTSFDAPDNVVSALLLLKLHGSINWRAKLGYPSPFAIESIAHHHEWSGDDPYSYIDGHLEPEPVMVPPVLSKSSLVEQPVLRLVWSHAFASLETAQ